MKISKQNVGKTAIIIRQSVTPREQFAAEELQKYIQKMTGARLLICDDGMQAELQLILGGPAHNSAAGELISEQDFNRLVPGPEGFLIKSFGEQKLLLAGSEGDFERGTIYAVYEFLERFCGCSLSAYSHPDVDAGEYVPQTDVLTVGNIEYCKPCADRPFRGACVQYSDCAGNPVRALNLPFFDFLAKNRYNYFYTWTNVYEKLKETGMTAELDRRGIRLCIGHHDALDLFLPADGNRYFPEKYYETHPAYFRLQEDGTRFRPVDHWGQMILCHRNEEMIRQISENIITWLGQNPEVGIVALMPHDGAADQCVCDLCRNYSKTENFVYFVNEVAKRVKAVHPHVRIAFSIYVDIWECPANMELDPSLLVLEATWYQDGLRTVGKPDGSCLNGTHFEKNLLQWQATGAQVAYYEYYMGVYQERQRYIPMADEIQAIWKRFQKKGILGASTQIECFHLWNYIFNFYTFGRTAYDSTLSMEDNLERFSRIFGGGAPYIREAIRLAEACMDGQKRLQYCGVYLMEHIDKEQMYRYYEQAFAAAETPFFRNNIRLMRMAFRYADLETQQENAASLEYQSVRTYPHVEPELLYMTRFDSFWKNDPGYGISIPLTGEADGTYTPDKWYLFE